MTEKIYMIPVNDAFSVVSNCPFCLLEKDYENQCIDIVLGESVMEVDERLETNKKGFCNKHFYMLLEQKNKLPFALTLETHLMEVNKNIFSIASKYLSSLDSQRKLNPIKALISSTKSNDDIINELNRYLDTLNSSCVICDRIKERMNSYFDVFFYMWKNEKDFQQKVLNTKGFCLPHLNQLIKMSKNSLSSSKLSDFLLKILKVQMDNMESLYNNVHNFTQQFDYRNANSIITEEIKSSLSIAVNKLAKFD